MLRFLWTTWIHDRISRPLNLRKTQGFHLNCVVYVRTGTQYGALHLREHALGTLNFDLWRKVVRNSRLVRIFTLVVISLVLVEIRLGCSSIYVHWLKFGPTFLIHAILLQGSLTYRRHKGGLMRGHSWLTDGIRVERLIYSSVELHKILKNLSCPQISSTLIRKSLPVDHFFALIDESSAHLKQFTPWKHIFTIVYRPWLILNASHLKQLHGVWGDTCTRQTILVEIYRDFVRRNFNAILRHQRLIYAPLWYHCSILVEISLSTCICRRNLLPFESFAEISPFTSFHAPNGRHWSHLVVFEFRSIKNWVFRFECSIFGQF